ncbi:hypothetical protein M758_3G197300 [Ceratodon purpureus]|nr:hypothetical protein M758_3G197300 [Ceratodon purpureus]
MHQVREVLIKLSPSWSAEVHISWKSTGQPILKSLTISRQKEPLNSQSASTRYPRTSVLPAATQARVKVPALVRSLNQAVMKICVLQSSYEGVNFPTEQYDDTPDPSLFTAQHEFHHRYLKKVTEVSEIDAAVAEGFDLFLNFMWGQPEDTVAGYEGIRRLESLNVPFVGHSSTTLIRSKLDFHRAAHAAGLPVPATASDMKFPVFVKPAKLCASIFIDEHSLCRDQAELDLQLQRINECLAPRRAEADKSNGAHTISNGHNDTSDGHNHTGSHGIETPQVKENLHDIVVQEYIPGRDYSCMVIEFGNTPVAMNPTRYRYPPECTSEFQTFDVKFHTNLKEEALVRAENPVLFDRIRELAEQAWQVNKMEGSNWCSVDIRERISDGKLFLLEVNPMPAIFYRWEHEFDDVAIRNIFPGGHRALINVLITSTLIQQGKHKEGIALVAATFDNFSPTYDSQAKRHSKIEQATESLVTAHDFSGSVLDLGCGTGVFGRKLYMHQKQHGMSPSSVVGNDISHGMVEKNPIPESYQGYKMGPLQDVVMNLTESFDHIVSLSTFQYLDEVTLSAVLARIFLVARKSVTFTIDEIPELQNELLEKASLKHMQARNHIAQVEAFGVPRGWRVAARERAFGWTSPSTNTNVFVTTFRFEALKPCN